MLPLVDLGTSVTWVDCWGDILQAQKETQKANEYLKQIKALSDDAAADDDDNDDEDESL